MQDRYGEYGFQVVCVLTQDSAEEKDHINCFMKDIGLRLPVLLDELGIIGARYGVALPPAHYLIEEGILRGFYMSLEGENRVDFEKLLGDVLDIPIGVPIPGPSDLLPPY
jgi:hypothetical protein